jgi:hypothetical protein
VFIRIDFGRPAIVYSLGTVSTSDASGWVGHMDEQSTDASRESTFVSKSPANRVEQIAPTAITRVVRQWKEQAIGGKLWLLGLCAALLGATLLVFALIAIDGQIFDLQCYLGSQQHAFRVKIPKYFGTPHITWAGLSSIELKVERFDEATIHAEFDGKPIWLNGAPDNATFMWFDFNRLTGEIVVTYLRKPTAEELKGVPPAPDGDWASLMTVLTSQGGTCTKSKPAF